MCVRKTAVLPSNVTQELGNKIDIAKPTVVLISVAQRSSSLGFFGRSQLDIFQRVEWN